MSKFIPVEPEKWAEMVQAQAENVRLKAEVERLRKAGDAMADAMWYGDAERSIWVKKFAESDWNSAKDGNTTK